MNIIKTMILSNFLWVVKDVDKVATMVVCGLIIYLFLNIIVGLNIEISHNCYLFRIVCDSYYILFRICDPFFIICLCKSIILLFVIMYFLFFFYLFFFLLKFFVLNFDVKVFVNENSLFLIETHTHKSMIESSLGH